MDYEKLADNAQTFDGVVSFASSMQSMLFGEGLSSLEEVNSLKKYKCVKEFFDLPIGDEKEGDLKKLFTAAVTVANESGELPFTLPENPEVWAPLIDSGLNRAKLAYKVAIGEMDLEDAADMLIDDITARTIAQVELAFESGIANQLITEGIIKASYAIPYVGEAVGPFMETQRYIISEVVSYAEPAIKEFTISGLKMINTCSKNVARKTIGFIREKSRNLFNKVLG